jgi:ribosome assembly protein YihI (activator of Der GTPase)
LPAFVVVAEREDRPTVAPRAVAEAEPLVPLPELEGLETAQLDTLLDALDEPFAGTSTLESSTLGDGAEDELERILATWEG